MRKILILTFVAVLLSNFAAAQEMTKEEKKRLKEELKAYMNDLAGYKAKVNDIKVTLDSNDAEIKRQKDDIATASAQIAELDNKLTDYIKELQRCNDSLHSIYGSSQPYGNMTLYDEGANTGNVSSSTAGAVIVNEDGTVSNSSGSISVKQGVNYVNATAKRGTVYKVQFGLYKNFNITKYFDQPRYIGYEDENGMNRYVISDFVDENVAMNFVEDVRRMGIKDAFVAKYIDGQRVYEWSKNPKYKGKRVPSSLEQALEMEKKGKKGKKND
ncbi:MAG: hypothetical protein V4615_17895 [Bacteroidota bacterium]